MASINWLKLTAQSASGLYVHLEQSARMSTKTHSNGNINPMLTIKNYSIGSSSYSEALKKMKDRTKSVDSVKPPKRVKKDRVVACMLEYTCPPEIDSKAFFAVMYEVLCEYFGKDNVHGSFIHTDEVHEYIDAESKQLRTSLVHAHTLVSAYTEEFGINGKNFETRARLNELNKITDYVIQKRFGIRYNTGKGKSYKSVTELKTESMHLEMQSSDSRSDFIEYGKQQVLSRVNSVLNKMPESTVAEFVRLWKEEEKSVQKSR